MPSNEFEDASCSYRSAPLNRSYRLLKRVQKTYEKFQKHPLPTLFKARLDGPSATWRVFSRLQLATAFADSCTKDCMIFAFEKKVANNGQRLFLVAHPQQMWHNHAFKHLEERCTYEVIRENYPCKLYFDLEYYTAFNSEKKGNHMTNIFIKCVIAFMLSQHGLLLKDSQFLWLDSSNDSKFSCHLILQMKGVAFENNIHAGTFVSLLTNTLRKRIEGNAASHELWPSSEEIRTLLVRSKKDKEVVFWDEGVYSRNRNFRLYLSTKYGKNCPLVLSPHNKYFPSAASNYRNEDIFYDSLITYFGNQHIYKILQYEQKDFDVSVNSRSMKNKSGISGCTSSPFPELDNHVLRIIKDDLIVGFIRKWTYHSNEQKIIYDIGNYRYCKNIGRHHKSNNIKIIVDMKAKCYYQTCLDPDCRQESFQSESIAIPDHILFVNVPDDFFDAGCFSQLQPAEILTDDNHNALLRSEEAVNFSSRGSLEDRKAENRCEISKCNKRIVDCGMIADTHCLDSTLTTDEMCEELETNFEDFSEPCKINKDATTTEDNSHVSNVETRENVTQDHGQDSWDAFFVDFPCTGDANIREREIYEDPNEDFSFLDKEESWSCDSTMGDSTLSLEEEMLMAEAAEATEAAMNENLFSEETMF